MVNSTTSPTVIVGVDGSTSADAAIEWAQRYCEATRASLLVVVAWQWPLSYGYPVAFEGYAPDEDAQRVAEKALAGLSLPADQVQSIVQEGMAGPVLVAAAANSALLVIGSHGHGALSGALLGSVSAYCVHHATVSVVVVR